MNNRRDWQSILVASLIICSIILGSCTTFAGAPTGVWVSEELGITIDFDDDGGLIVAAQTVIGTIVTDGEIREIVIGICPTGSATFRYIEEAHKHPSVRRTLFHGSFRNPVENEMVFVRGGLRYTFVRIDGGVQCDY